MDIRFSHFNVLGRFGGGRSVRRAALAALAAIGLALLLNGSISPAWSDDFGGPTMPNPPDKPPDGPPPCHNKCGCGPKAGDPISLLDGAERHSVTDLTVNGLFPIVMRRTYDSRSEYDTPLGYGWAFQHDRRLFEYPDGSVVIRHGCGYRNRYVMTGGAYVTPNDGVRGQLTEKPDGRFEFAYYDGSFDFFDAEGRLSAEVDRNGQRHDYRYADVDGDGRPDKFPLTGTSPHAVDPTRPMVVAYVYRLTRIEERGADGALTGRFVEFSYDTQTGRLTGATTDDGRTISYRHDVHPGANLTDPADDSTRGNLVGVTGLENTLHTYQYTDPRDEHNLTSIQEGVGRTPYVNTYDDRDRVIQQTHGAGKLVFTYPIDREQTTLTRTIADANGAVLSTAVSRYDFYPSGFVKQETDALGHQTRYQYDSANNLIRQERWQNENGALSLLQATDYGYNAQGDRIRQAVTLGNETITTTWTYQKGWISSEQTVSSATPGKIFRTDYTFYTDTAGIPTNLKERKRRRDDGSFQITAYTYDSRNRLLTTTLPDGVQIVNDYTGDSLYVTQTTFKASDGSAIAYLARRFGYDTRGNLTDIWDARNAHTQTVFDARNRPATTTNPLGEQTLYTYTDDRLTQIETGRSAAGSGQVTKLLYNAEDRLIAIQRQDENGTFLPYQTFTYDSEGHRLSATDAENRTTTFSYDPLGQMIHVTDPATRRTQFTYDAAGNRTGVTDALNRVTVSRYDALNRLVATEQRGITPAALTRYTYDAVGNLTSVTDPENHTTAYEYDALSRRTAEIKPLGQRLEVDYDERDQPTERRTARNQKISYIYAPWGGLLNTRYYPNLNATTPERTLTYSYDLAGNPASASDDSLQAAPLYTIEYDALNRPSMTQIGYLPGSPVSLHQTYHRYGGPLALTLNDGQTLTHTYGYDRRNRLSDATLLPDQHFGFEYDLTDELKTLLYPNGVRTRFTYEPNGPIKTLSTTTSTQSPLQDRLYTYTPVLNISAITDTDGLYQYDYDGLNRLTAATPPITTLPAEHYEYDRVGNREDPADPQRYSYDANNRIQQSPDYTYTFDADGNLATRSDGATFTHDADNRLHQFVRGSQNITYRYDPQGRRIAKSLGGQTTWYLWAGDRLLAEYDHQGNRTQAYGYLPGHYLPVQTTKGTRTYYAHGDHLQTPRLLTDESQRIAWRARYESFGNAVVETDVDGDGTPISFNFRFPGQYYDQESGLHYNYFRDYDPQTGRYVQSDPMGLEGGINAFLYANENPIRFIDFFGLEPIETFNPNNWKDCIAIDMGYGIDRRNYSYTKELWRIWIGIYFNNIGITSSAGPFKLEAGLGLEADYYDVYLTKKALIKGIYSTPYIKKYFYCKKELGCGQPPLTWESGPHKFKNGEGSITEENTVETWLTLIREFRGRYIIPLPF